MELCPHGDLFDFITKSAQISDEHLLKLIMVQISFGLEALHDNEISHNDVKSENIFISSDYTFKVADFDQSECSKEPLNWSAGTPMYMPPEVRALAYDASKCYFGI